MSKSNLAVDDFDPLVLYSNYDDWQTPNPQDNPTWWNATQDVTKSVWHQATYHYTTVQGAKASFKFTGSSIAVYGAAGPDASNYTVTIDPSSKQPFTTSLQTKNATEGRTLLYSSDELSNTKHEIEITNAGSGLLLDLFVVGMELGGDGATLTNTTLDDRSPEIRFEGAWTQQTGPNFHDQTSTYTSGPGNALTLNFSGSAIYVYGDQVNDHGEYSVSINGTDMGTFNGRSGCGGGYAKFCEKLHGLEFFAALPQGTHALHIENLGPAEGNKTFFDFDYIEYTVPSVYAAQGSAGDCPFANCSVSTTGGASGSGSSAASTGGAGATSGAGGHAVPVVALWSLLGAWVAKKLL